MNISNVYFDCVINKDIFNFEDENVFEWYFKTLYYETTDEDIVKNDSIMIITDREPKDLMCELMDMFRNSEYYMFKESYSAGMDNKCIYCGNLGSKKNEIRVLIISSTNNESFRGWRNKAVILDINKEETEIPRKYLEMCIFTTLMYSNENKLSHGRILFHKNKNLINFIK